MYEDIGFQGPQKYENFDANGKPIPNPTQYMNMNQVQITELIPAPRFQRMNQPGPNIGFNVQNNQPVAFDPGINITRNTTVLHFTFVPMANADQIQVFDQFGNVVGSSGFQAGGLNQQFVWDFDIPVGVDPTTLTFTVSTNDPSGTSAGSIFVDQTVYIPTESGVMQLGDQ